MTIPSKTPQANPRSFLPTFFHRLRASTLALCLALGLAAPASAQEAQARATAPAPTGFVAEFLADHARLEDRFLSLAEAIPAERYAWRPAEGVRSVAEVLLHIAQVNLLSAQGAGVPLPEGLPEDPTQVTDKGQIVKLLATSFGLTTGAARGLAAAGLDLDQPPPGSDQGSLRGAMVQLNTHAAEHLGQLVAYARVNGVVPPWSR